MGDPVLYRLSRSVYTRIARLALEEQGVRYVDEAFAGRGCNRRTRTHFSLAHEGVETLAAHTRWRAWLDNVAARPSVQQTKGKYELGR